MNKSRKQLKKKKEIKLNIVNTLEKSLIFTLST